MFKRDEYITASNGRFLEEDKFRCVTIRPRRFIRIYICMDRYTENKLK